MSSKAEQTEPPEWDHDKQTRRLGMNIKSSLGWAVFVLGVTLARAGQSNADPASPEKRLAGIESQIASDPLLAGINSDEDLVVELDAALLSSWERAFLARDAEAFTALGPGARLNFESAQRTLRREREGVREYDWTLAAGGKSSEAKRYLARFERIDHFNLSPWRVTPRESSVELEVNYDLRGETAHGSRRQDRGRLVLELKRAPSQAWTLQSVRPLAMESLEAKQPVFADATAAWGLDRVPVVDRREAIRRGGYAIAAADYDGDKRPDLLVGGWGPVKLYRNTGSGFEDVTEKAGLQGETLVKSAAFADLDNDGQRDLLLLRFVENGKEKSGGKDFIAYRNVGGKFVRAGEKLTRSRIYDRTMPIAMADFDRDGNLDLYLGFPGSRDFTSTIGKDSQSLKTQGLWLNDGKWNFSEVSKESEIWNDGNIYPHSAIASDIDRDGWPDLVVMNDRAGVSPVYRNLGAGRFKEVSSDVGIVNASWAMTSAAGDYDGDGFVDLAVTNIDFLASRRILASRAGRSTPEENTSLESVRFNSVGNRLFRNKGDGTFEETTDKAGIRWAGEASAGAEWLDVSNTGRHDLYILNGLWSGGARDISSLYMRVMAHRKAQYAHDVVDGVMDSPLSQPDEMSGPNPLLGLLRQIKSPGTDQPALSMAGGQRNAYFRNNEDGTFTEVGYLLGADRTEDGYVVSMADVDGDGDQDMLLRNGDPAPGMTHPTVTLLLNQTPTEGHRSLTVYAEGGKSNRDGIGARVTAVLGQRRIVREIRGPVGASQSEPVAFFGLGTAEKVDRLEVFWPSGLNEEFAGVPAGRVVLREGKGIVKLAAR